MYSPGSISSLVVAFEDPSGDSAIASDGENPLCLWALWGALALEAEASQHGCDFCIQLILPTLIHPLAFFSHGQCFCLYSNWLPLVSLPPFLGPQLCFYAWCLLWFSVGISASVPWTLCTPYTPPLFRP